MNSVVTERECRGKYYITSTQEVPGHYEEFESGPAQYTTAIVELTDGRVIATTPRDIQFVNAKRIKASADKKEENPLAGTVGAVGIENDEITFEDKKDTGKDNEGAKKGKEQKAERKRVDHRKIRALKNAGWSNKEIAEEMHMTPGAVANSLSTHKELIEELKRV